MTFVAALIMSFALSASASAQLTINQVDASASARQAIDQAGASADAVPESPNGIYIIQMIGDPVVAYEGGIKGLKATKPRKGKKINPNSQHVIDYVRHLNGKHAQALNSVGGGQNVYNYQYSFNGFAAKLSHDQAKQMQSVDGVVAVRADELLILDTATTPGFIGLEDSGGLWEQLGGVGSSGEDVIIGIVDGGIWPESLSFTDRTGTNGNASKDGKLDYHQIPGWHGKCTPGEEFNASHCNQKLIGAQYYNAGFGGNDGIDAQIPYEFNSPRDFGGHGSHTSSTAGGNHNTPLTGDAADLLGTVSGIAPRARIATYKVCWQFPAGGSCATSDSTAAIDQAVADGVDVINYSISGSRTNFLDSVEVAFLFAADAGVFVATSAGNSGPGASTVAHPGPWLTSTAATTHDRNFSAEVVLGDAAGTFVGASTNTTGAGPADLVYSADVGLGGADPNQVRLCYPGTLDPALVTGKIVLCDRGAIARVDKSLAVFMAGGVGSILANPNPGQSQNADFHSVPTVHVDNVSGDAIRAYATGGGTPTAQIFPSFPDPDLNAPSIAGFSSRGPLLAGDGNLLKPDIAAPGVDVLAAVAPPGNGGADFASYSGTSMASPHVAGLAALLTQLHPDWSPMMIKSALMTSATDLLSGPDPFAQGAGFVNPTGAADPGLVYDHGFFDWLDFLIFGGDVVDVNGASIAIGALLGNQTVSRTVTNVGSATEIYEFSYSVPGINIVANPASFSVAPGASATYELTLSVDGAALNTYATGFVYWTGDLGHVVRSPVAVQPAAIKADAEVDGAADGAGDGSVGVGVEFGYDGAYFANVSGLAAGLSGSDNIVGPQGNLHIWCVDLPANTHFRAAMFDEDTSDPGADDLDLRLFHAATDCATFDISFVGSSGGATSEEVIDVSNGPAGGYVVVVDYFAASNGTDTDYTIWFQPVFGDNGNTVVTAPGAAVQGVSDTVTVDYTGLAPTRNLGILHHEDGSGEIARTILDIDAR
jgi:subtilisin family serine protease